MIYGECYLVQAQSVQAVRGRERMKGQGMAWALVSLFSLLFFYVISNTYLSLSWRPYKRVQPSRMVHDTTKRKEDLSLNRILAVTGLPVGG